MKKSRLRNAVAAFSTIIVLLAIAPQKAAAVTLNGLDWRQVTDTTGLTWNQVNSVCSGTNNACSGSVGGVNFDGWSWASQDHVVDMLAAYTPLDTNDISGQTFSGDYLANTALSMLDPTSTSSPASIWGHVSDTDQFGGGVDVFISSSTVQTQIYLGGSNGKNYTNSTLGAWLYRDVTPVPVPAAIWLFGSGLLGLVGMARRKNT